MLPIFMAFHDKSKRRTSRDQNNSNTITLFFEVLKKVNIKTLSSSFPTAGADFKLRSRNIKTHITGVYTH